MTKSPYTAVEDRWTKQFKRIQTQINHRRSPKQIAEKVGLCTRTVERIAGVFGWVFSGKHWFGPEGQEVSMPRPYRRQKA